jgi:hypothetical protein
LDFQELMKPNRICLKVPDFLTSSHGGGFFLLSN